MLNILLLALHLFLSSGGDDDKKKMVYVCPTTQSVTWHKYKDCSALASCSEGIKTVEVTKAQNKGRKLCKICKKKKEAMSHSHKDGKGKH